MRDLLEVELEDQIKSLAVWVGRFHDGDKRLVDKDLGVYCSMMMKKLVAVGKLEWQIYGRLLAQTRSMYEGFHMLEQWTSAGYEEYFARPEGIICVEFGKVGKFV